MTLSECAIDYVNLVLAVGRHDAAFVDAYYGPRAWQAAAEAGEPRPLAALRAEAQRLLDAVTAIGAVDDEALRRDYLQGQLGAVAAHLARLEGRRFTFDEEAEALYQVRPPKPASAPAATRRCPPRTTSGWNSSRARPGPPTTGTRAAAVR